MNGSVVYSVLLTVGLILGGLVLLAAYYLRKSELVDTNPTKVSEPKKTFHYIDSWANLPTFGEEGHRYFVESTKTIYEWKDSCYSIVKHQNNHE